MRKLSFLLLCSCFIVHGQIVRTEIGAPAFVGTGLNDIAVTGSYVGLPRNHRYTITVAATGGTDTVNYDRDGVAPIGPFAMTTAPQPLYYGAGFITGASWSAGRVTFTDVGHAMATGTLVTVGGASPSGYNVTLLPVTVIDSSHFSVPVASDPGTWTSGGVATGNDGLTVAWAAITGHSTIAVWNLDVTSIAAPGSVIQRGVGAVVRPQQDKFAERVSVKDFGGLGDGSSSVQAIEAAWQYLCGLSGSRQLDFPAPAKNYLIDSTIVAPCGNILLQGTGIQPKILSSAAGAAFDTNSQSDITFDRLWLASATGNVPGQVGIYVNGSTTSANTTIRGSFLGAFGTKPNVISSGTNANPAVFTTPTSQPAAVSGAVYLAGFGGGWAGINGPQTATALSATTFSVAIDSTSFGPVAGAPRWSYTAIPSGSAIQVRGDNIQLNVRDNTIEVWGTGLDIDGTVDLLEVADNDFGVANGNDSGYGITLKNSIGSGQNRIYHNDFVTPGCAAYIGPGAGIVQFANNQYEALTFNPVPSCANGSAYTFDSALFYWISGNFADLHGTAPYGYTLQNWQGSKPENNPCDGAAISCWNLAGVGNAVELSLNTNLLAQSNGVYSNPVYPGIYNFAANTNNRSWGTAYGQAPFHFNFLDVPLGGDTTLAANVLTTDTTISVMSAAGIQMNDLLYLMDTTPPEQVAVVGPPVGTTVPVSRGENGTSVSAHAAPAAVSFGPGGGVLFHSTRSPNSYMSWGCEAGYCWNKVMQYGGGTFTPIPMNYDALQVQSHFPGVNTKFSIWAVNGQADYPLEILDYLGNRKVSVSSIFSLDAPLYCTSGVCGITGSIATGGCSLGVAAGLITSNSGCSPLSQAQVETALGFVPATSGGGTNSATTGITVATTCTSTAVPPGGGTPTITCTSTPTDPGHVHQQN
ncbi:MAG TPA: hypothetical protein VHY84_15025 [Bryobacteraceae bacterium]|jgi:hypothetical protein|nr:hypothetical protein [Bryobacteraceae bacterium]